MVPIGGSALPSFAAALNDHGVVVGSMNMASGERHAFVWRGAEMVDLGVLPGDGNSQANAINNRGQIVGESNLKSFGAAKAVLWIDGRMEVLPPLPGFNQARAVDINDRGQVVGVSLRVGADSHVETRATLWEGGVGEPLEGASAVAINQRGQVAGFEQGTSLGPVLWTGGAPLRLGGLQAVRDVNNLAVAVGHDEAREVILTWGRFTYPLGINGYGWSINDRLQVAGVYGPGLQVPFVWSLGETIELPTPGGGGGDAAGLNRHGEVTGSDSFRAVLWTCDAVNRR
jgi:probable HAF family extracellular repeat protein